MSLYVDNSVHSVACTFLELEFHNREQWTANFPFNIELRQEDQAKVPLNKGRSNKSEITARFQWILPKIK